ncbi:hypothetical protein EBB59_13095 [Lysobacter pythonis]|uniref:Uncharacterized protein n=2 Tax=Solilutibacter pythonis TaxID=2483112 RepID=A0A3M2HCE0_9GAMM|nr:hypothetical protein EBB59_13095 [Lysobacter pythonis]
MIGNVVTAHSRQALGAQRGGIDYGDLAADAFGNALGNAAAGRLDRRARARQFMAAWRNLPLEEQLKWLSMSFYDAGSFSGDAPSGASPLGEAPMAGTVSERLSDVKGRPAAFEQAARERVSRQQVVSDLRQRGLPDSITVNVADDADYSEFISAYGDYGTQPAGASEFDRITVMGSSTGTELPAIENLYTPYQGWWMDKYSTFTAMLDDLSGGWRQKAGALAGGMLTVIPTMAESLIKGVYDAPNNASLAGQKWGQASQLKGHDSALAYLEGGQYFLGAFQGLGDAVTLGTVSSARPSVPGLAPAVVAERVGVANSIRPSYLSATEFANLPRTGTIDPRVIRYSQDSASVNFKPPYGAVDDFINGLRSGDINPASIEPVRIVQRDGKVFTLDNRRLHSFERAGINITYQKLDKIPRRELFKFTTTNDGTSILIRQRRNNGR